ncbi:RICIN domain-containing protein [Streptomyces sp. NPDC017638]|uniref:RICIN domain-containing protein n=1 Tax=Streptomyces sp. NPDC017638 TaxID=3365004 RepID=UPI0037B71BAF
MLTPHPPRPSCPPSGAAPAPGESDEFLAGPLRAGSDAEASRSAALLMARHWQPAHEYAVICLAGAGPLAHMVTATAFHQVFGRLALGESADALRPRLLVTVRDTVVNWSGTDRITAVLPGLAKPAGGRGMRAARTPTPENRVLSESAFHGLSPLEQALLWHAEVEAEPPAVPAALLGIDAENATALLGQAREKFREGLVRAHRERAPGRECRYHNRLLDVAIRRGGALLPDVREHLAGCAHCRHAADQLGHAEAAPGVLLAEAVLGWGARRYLDSRPGRRPGPARGRGPRRSGGRRRGGRPGRFLVRAAAGRPDGAARSPRTLPAGLGLVAAGLLATVLAVCLWPDGGAGGPGPAVPTGAATGTGGPSPSASAGLPAAGRPGPLRNGTGLCLDVKGPPRAGTSAVLAVCSAAATQRWTYGGDGVLRSAAGAGLCLDSHADAGVVLLGDCPGAGAARGADVRYDLTPQGELTPRWDRSLALAAGAGQPGADVVVKVRDGSAGERWT